MIETVENKIYTQDKTERNIYYSGTVRRAKNINKPPRSLIFGLSLKSLLFTSNGSLITGEYHGVLMWVRV